MRSFSDRSFFFLIFTNRIIDSNDLVFFCSLFFCRLSVETLDSNLFVSHKKTKKKVCSINELNFIAGARRNDEITNCVYAEQICDCKMRFSRSQQIAAINDHFNRKSTEKKAPRRIASRRLNKKEP